MDPAVVMTGTPEIQLAQAMDGAEKFTDELLASGALIPEGEVANAGKVVIGQTMERVISYAKKVGADWYKGRTTNPANYIKNNMQWLNRQKRAGKEIIDIGADAKKVKPSPNYEAEKANLERSKYPVTQDPQP